MKLTMGKRELELGGPYLGTLEEATHLMGDMDALRARMEEDGYLLIRKLHDPTKVKAARRVVVENLAANGQIDTAFPLDEAVIASGARGAFLGGAKAVTHTPEFLAIVESPELMQFLSDFLGAPALTYNYKWMRAVGQGDFTGAHYDVVYMGRGTLRLFTVWTPLGEVPYEKGPLAVLGGSNRFERIKETYGQMDVDRDHVEGWFSSDPIEMVERYGGRWLSTEFEPGDAMIFGMFTMHGSLNNATNRYRLSCDTRYQRADEPADERWIGENPIAHYAWTKGEMISMEEARRRWGV
ncbi:MAG: phytanoyl-CoA dioxygenase family protein [Armatimonadetes bacterium]|nr:phytanoyl-CoA dioxygenase family protein [Armatimonadota bacterium]